MIKREKHSTYASLHLPWAAYDYNILVYKRYMYVITLYARNNGNN